MCPRSAPRRRWDFRRHRPEPGPSACAASGTPTSPRNRRNAAVICTGSPQDRCRSRAPVAAPSMICGLPDRRPDSVATSTTAGSVRPTGPGADSVHSGHSDVTTTGSCALHGGTPSPERDVRKLARIFSMRTYDRDGRTSTPPTIGVRGHCVDARNGSVPTLRMNVGSHREHAEPGGTVWPTSPPWPRPSRRWSTTATRWPWRGSPTSSRSPPVTRSSGSGRRDLTLIRMTPDLIYDQLIGAGCARAAGLLLGRQPGRRLAAPVARRASTTAGRHRCEIEEHSHAGMANRYVAGASGPAVRGAARLRRHRPRRAHRHHRHGHLPVHRRGADRGARAQPGRQRSSTPSGPTGGATSSCGASSACRRRRCWPRKRSLVTVEEIVDDLEPRARRGRPARLGGDRGGRRPRAGPIPRTRRVTTTATTTPTGPGTRSAATGRAFAPGWTTNVYGATAADARDRLHRGRDDDRRRGPGPGRPDRLLRRHRPAEHGGQPGPPAAQSRPVPDLRVGHHRRQADRTATVHRGR